MAFDINDIRSKLVGGGASPNKFMVNITNPATNIADLDTPFMVKATSLPAYTVGQIEVPYFGRKIKLVGDRTYESWTVTVINDENFKVRQAMELWQNSMNSARGNTTLFGTASPSAYKSEAEVNQYSKDGSILRTYNFHGIFPVNIAAIDLNWETVDAIQEFTVEFAYDWFDVTGKTGTVGKN